MMIAHACEKIGASNVWLGYHERATGNYKTYQCPIDSTCDLTDYATLFEVLHIRPSLRTLPKMENYAKNPIRRLWHVWVRDLNARLGRENFFTRKGLSLNDWKTSRARMTRFYTMSSGSRLDDVARRGDRFVILDIAWQPKRLDPWLQHASNRLGLEVWAFLHDLIPLVTPQYVKHATCHRFHERLLGSTKYVTCYLVNSEHTGRDLRTFLEFQNASQPVEVVPLAQDIVSDATQKIKQPNSYSAFIEGTKVPDAIQALTKTPYVLVVGTLEVRKNLWQLATVWDRLRRQSGRALPKLVFAGRRGWLNDDFDALMIATGQLGGWAEFVEEPDDTALSYLYRNCLFTVTVSFYEGWGLPIGESLAYGKTAVVSNTSSMPEVGGDLVEYCDPHSLDDIEAACLKLIDDPEHRQELEARIRSARLRSWDDVATDMLAAIA
jgi:glycosyltransferase involved in cell wall biosynthesis